MIRQILAAAVPLAALTLAATPAAAVDGAIVAGVTVHRGSGGFGGDWGDRRRHRNNGGVAWVAVPEYQGDSAWRPTGFNDWWHERPERNSPRWLNSNGDCQRLYWTGGGWRC